MTAEFPCDSFYCEGSRKA